jgi:hypothetical protein
MADLDDLRDILATHLGCWQVPDGPRVDKCGEHTHLPWPCDRLVALETDVQQWQEDLPCCDAHNYPTGDLT